MLLPQTHSVIMIMSGKKWTRLQEYFPNGRCARCVGQSEGPQLDLCTTEIQLLLLDWPSCPLKAISTGVAFVVTIRVVASFFHIISSLAPRFCVLEKFRSEEKTGMTVSTRILGFTTNVVEWLCALRHSKSWSLGQGLWIKVERVLLKLLHCICVSVWGDEKRGSGDWEKCVEMDGAVADGFPSSRGTITYSLL